MGKHSLNDFVFPRQRKRRGKKEKKIPKEILDQYPQSTTSRGVLLAFLAHEYDLKKIKPDLDSIRNKIKKISDKEVENELQAVFKRTR